MQKTNTCFPSHQWAFTWGQMLIFYKHNFCCQSKVICRCQLAVSTLGAPADANKVRRVWFCRHLLGLPWALKSCTYTADTNTPFSVVFSFGRPDDQYISDAVGLIHRQSVAMPYLFTWLQKQPAMHADSKNRWRAANADKGENERKKIWNVRRTKMSDAALLCAAEHQWWNGPHCLSGRRTDSQNRRVSKLAQFWKHGF